LPFAIYIASARHDVWFWDTGEMDTVPWIAGIAHPTGFPAYVIVGFVFTHLFAFGSVAFRMSVLSALAMSIASWFVALAVEEDGGNLWIAMGCAWIFAFGSIAWTHATRAEVHSLVICAIAATIFFALRWHRTGERRDLYKLAASFGFGLGVHPLILLLLPGIVVLAASRGLRKHAGELAIAATFAAIFGAAWYLYLPLRSEMVSAQGLDPTRLLGIPSGNAFWDYDHPASWHGFVALVFGSAFNPLAGAGSMFSPATYRGLPDYFSQLYSEMSSFGVSMAVGGIAAAWAKSRVRTVALLLFCAAVIPFGLGFTAESDPYRYFLTSFLVLAIFCGAAGSWLAQRLRFGAVFPAAIVAAIALSLMVENRWIFPFAGDERARAVITDVRRSTPNNAIIVANWLDAPPLAYASYVEHSLGQRVVEAAWLGDVASKLPAWMKQHAVYALGSDQSATGYRLAPVAAHSSLSRVVASIATH
jgi:hypothetical protein